MDLLVRRGEPSSAMASMASALARYHGNKQPPSIIVVSCPGFVSIAGLSNGGVLSQPALLSPVRAVGARTMASSSGAIFDVKVNDDGIAVIRMDDPSAKVNTLSESFMEQVSPMIDEVGPRARHQWIRGARVAKPGAPLHSLCDCARSTATRR